MSRKKRQGDPNKGKKNGGGGVIEPDGRLSFFL